MRSGDSSTKRPRPDSHSAPHSSMPPPTARYQDSAAPYNPNPSTLPPSTGRGFSISDPYTSPGLHGLPEMRQFNQDPNRGLGIAPGTHSGPVLPENSQALPPSNPSHPSPINTRPHQTAISGIPLSHQQPLPPTTDNNHHASTSYYHDLPPGDLGYNYPPYVQQVAVKNVQKRRPRVEVACNTCRKRKHKCDEERPCQNCRELGLECIYRDAQLPKQDRTLYELAKNVSALTEAFTSIPQRLDDIERQLRARQTSSKLRNIAARVLSAHKTLLSSQTTLTTYHAAATHTMLEWPIMKPFVQGIMPSGTNYPQELEGSEEPKDSEELEDQEEPGNQQELEGEREILKSGLNPETLDLSRETVKSLHKSYLKGIHPSQPLLDAQHLAFRIEEFVKRYSPDAASRSSRINPTIDNAIVLLVLALGRICKYKTYLLGPISLNDATPGLDYYTFASSILYTVHGCNNLLCGQAGVLACLYKDQLACVSGSWSWIQYVCRICGVLIDKNKESLNPNALRLGVSDKIAAQEAALGVAKGVDSCGVKSIKFLYWTCWQLESNIRAEMSHLRPNNISENAGRIGLPSRMEPSEEIDLMCFSAQIYLEKILKEAQAALYGKRQKQSAVYNDILEDQLRTWRESLPECLQWDDSDEPSKNLNKARMRAKYYGAIHIITRPTLLHAIHVDPAPDFLPNEYGFTCADENNSPDSSESSESLSKDDWHRVIMASKRCINSAVQSITAFDGIDANERLIVTNVFGTTHAQFGNCLVLAAVRKSWMRDLVSHDRVIGPIERTIRLLRRLEPVSPTLRVDTMILEKALKTLRGKQPEVV